MKQYTVRIGTWIEGTPVEHERFSGFNLIQAIDHLHEIGASKEYDGRRFCGYIYKDEQKYAILHIYAPEQIARVEWILSGEYCSCPACRETTQRLGEIAEQELISLLS